MVLTNPAYLWALALVAIPIAVHLFHFRRYRKVYFSNVESLTQLRLESRRRRTLREVAVLLCRVLAIVALVMAFARPVIPHEGLAPHSGSTAVSIYIDNSFSMEAASDEGNRLEAAKQRAREIAAAYSPADRFHLMTNNMSGSEMRWLGRSELLDAIDAVSPSAAVSTIAEAAARQASFLRRQAADNRMAYIISDFQQSTAHLADLEPDSLVHLTLIPLPAAEAANLYIDTLTLDAPAYHVGGSATAQVTVRNSGTTDVEKVAVRLYLDGRERAIATLDLAAGASGTVSMPFSIDRAGQLEGRAEISDHPITFDDSYFFTIDAGRTVHMLEVDGAAANPHLKKLFAADSLVSHRAVPLQRLDIASLDDHSLLLLNEVASLGSGEVQAIASWVNGGGSLVVVPPAGQQELNPLLAAVGAPQLGGWDSRPCRAAEVNIHSSLFRNVFVGNNSEMEMPTAAGHYADDAAGAANSEALVSLAGGDRLLTLSRCGDGKVYLFRCPLTADYTSFVAQALFVPTLYNMALFSQRQAPAAYTLGQTALLPLAADDLPADGTAELRLGGGAPLIPDLRNTGGRILMVPHGEMQEAGIYTLGTSLLAFNYSRDESDMRFLSADEVARHSAAEVIKPSATPLDQRLRERMQGRPLWRWFILAALAALLAESLLLIPRKSNA